MSPVTAVRTARTCASIVVVVAITAAVAEPEPVTSRITAVTVHLQHAVVTREVTASLGPGEHRIDVLVDRDDTTAALPPDPREPGIMKWDLAVPAAGRADVTLHYRIRAPAGMLPAEP